MLWPCWIFLAVVAASIAVPLWMILVQADMRTSPRRLLSTVGLVLGVIAVLLGVLPFGYVGMFFAPIVLLIESSGSNGEIVRLWDGVTNWKLFILLSIGGNVALGWCIGTFIAFVRNRLRGE